MAIVEIMVSGSFGDANGNPGVWKPADPNYTGDPPPAVDWSLIADNSDSTYIYQDGPRGGGSRFAMQDYTIPTNAQVRTVTVKVRASKAEGAFPTELNINMGSIGTILEQVHKATLDRTIADHLSPAWADPNSGRKWLQDEVGGLSIVLSAHPDEEELAPGTRVYRLSALLDVNHQPVVTATGPTGVVATTSKPTLTFTYSDPEGDAMERRKLRVFSEAQYTASGFDPATSAAFVEVMEEFTSSVSWQVPKYLPNGKWRFYPSASDVGSDGRYSLFGSFTEWSQLVPTPTAPVLAVTQADTTNNRVQLLLTPTDAVNTTHFIVERDDGGGYQDVLRVAASGATTAYDYTAPRGSQVSYRARAVFDDGSSYSESGPSSAATTTLASDGSSWLKSTTNSALNMKISIRATELESNSTEDVVFHEPMGRSDPIPVAGTIRLESFEDIPIFFKTKADYQAFETLRKRQETLLLQIAAGAGLRDQWFIRFGENRRLVTAGAAVDGGRVRMVAVEAREVRRPAV